MTAEDVNQLLAIMKANYSYAFKTMSQQEKYMLLGTWTVTLQDLPTDVVLLAVMQLVSQSKWMPTVAEIREKCREMHYAASAPDDSLDTLLAAGLHVTPDQQRRHDALQARRRYIAQATRHLRDESAGALSMDSLLANPALEGVGTGRAGFLLRGGEPPDAPALPEE